MYFRRLIRDTFNCINIIDEKVDKVLVKELIEQSYQLTK